MSCFGAEQEMLVTGVIPQAQVSSHDGRDKLALFDSTNSLQNLGKTAKSINLLFLINQSDSRAFLGIHVTICKTK